MGLFNFSSKPTEKKMMICPNCKVKVIDGHESSIDYHYEASGACPSCRGERTNDALFGLVTIDCISCKGSGKCSRCKGEGYVPDAFW